MGEYTTDIIGRGRKKESLGSVEGGDPSPITSLGLSRHRIIIELGLRSGGDEFYNLDQQRGALVLLCLVAISFLCDMHLYP
jgi:hypothetical protein